MRIVLVSLGAGAAVVAALAPVAVAGVASPVAAATALPAAIVMRIPTSPLRAPAAPDAGAPLARGEFASPVRTIGDRTALRASIERERAADNERFARGAGRGVTVQLRRHRF